MFTTTLRQFRTISVRNVRNFSSAKASARFANSNTTKYMMGAMGVSAGLYYMNSSRIELDADKEKIAEDKAKAQEQSITSTPIELVEVLAIEEVKPAAEEVEPAQEAEVSESPELSESSEQEQPEEKSNQAAYNPETGEINWDCPCLGGMAHGPCGEEFKEAFSCFVFSETEPKGINCIEKFEGMRSCFRRYPEVYKEELEDDEEYENERRAAAPVTPIEAAEAVEAVEAVDIVEATPVEFVEAIEIQTPTETIEVVEVVEVVEATA